MQEEARALGVPEELMPQALALGGAGNESRQVRDDEGAVHVHTHDAELGRRGRERVVGDLRRRRADARDERRLAGVRKADDTDVGEELQLESQPAAVSGTSQIRLARRAVGGRREARIPPAPTGARLDEDPLARAGEIAQRLVTFAEGQVVATGAMAVRALAVLAALRLVMALVVIVEEGGQRGIGFEPDTAAVTTVAAVGATIRDVFFTTEADAARAAVTAFDEDFDLVDEHEGLVGTRAKARPCQAEGATTLM